MVTAATVAAVPVLTVAVRVMVEKSGSVESCTSYWLAVPYHWRVTLSSTMLCMASSVGIGQAVRKSTEAQSE